VIAAGSAGGVSLVVARRAGWGQAAGSARIALSAVM
jgi:hypothetical protein